MFACPLSQWLSTLTEVIHLVGQYIMERKHGVNAISHRAVQEIYKKSHSHYAIEVHCEIYLTPSLEYVLQGLINVRLILKWPSKMKYFPDNTLYSLFKQWN